MIKIFYKITKNPVLQIQETDILKLE